jgi:pimeloyl-ACP methyl ester carboxylesterase
MFTTHLLKGGTGKPLVFLHGAGGLRPGAPWLEALAARYTVYAPWHPGFGRSEGLEHIDDVRDLATYYQDLFDALGLQSPPVVGHSLGGMIATEIAAQCSVAASQLVLVAPVGLWRDDAPLPDIFTMGPQETAQLAFADPEGPLAQQAMTMPEDQEQLAALMIDRIQSLAAAGKFLWPIPDKGLPTLILWGEADKLAPPVYAEEFHSRIPGSKLVMVPGAGHMLPLEKQDVFVQAVTDFVG